MDDVKVSVVVTTAKLGGLDIIYHSMQVQTIKERFGLCWLTNSTTRGPLRSGRRNSGARASIFCIYRQDAR